MGTPASRPAAAPPVPRLQQPKECYIAALPTELLTRILSFSLGNDEPFHQQRARVGFALVCASWCGAAELVRNLAFVNVERANELVKTAALQRRGQVVRSLSMVLGERRTIATLIALLEACPNLESLHFMARGSCALLHETTVETLQRLRRMQHLTLEFTESGALAGSCALTSASLFRLITSWPLLHSLHLSGMPPLSSWQPSLPTLPTRRIISLSIQLSEVPGLGLTTLSTILVSSSASIRHLDLDYIDCDPLNGGPLSSSSAMQDLLRVIPQLQSLRVIIGPDRHYPGHNSYSIGTPFLTGILGALRDVENLELGLHGYEVAYLFWILQSLSRLSSLTICDKSLDSEGPFAEFDCETVEGFLLEAPALKRCTLPVQLGSVWTYEELEWIMDYAAWRNIDLFYG